MANVVCAAQLPSQEEPSKREEVLARLNHKLRVATVVAARAQSHWDTLIERAAFLEAVINKVGQVSAAHAPYGVRPTADPQPGARSHPRLPAPTLPLPPAAPASCSSGTTLVRAPRRSLLACVPHADMPARAAAAWVYRMRWSRYAQRVLAVLCGAMSLMVLWCEVTMFIPASLSVFGAIIEAAAARPILVLLLALLPLTYVSVCLYRALFHIKLPGVQALGLYSNGCASALRPLRSLPARLRGRGMQAHGPLLAPLQRRLPLPPAGAPLSLLVRALVAHCAHARCCSSRWASTTSCCCS